MTIAQGKGKHKQKQEQIFSGNENNDRPELFILDPTLPTIITVKGITDAPAYATLKIYNHYPYYD